MKETSLPLKLPALDAWRWKDRIARNLVIRRLSQLEQGALTLVEGGDRTRFGDPDPQAQPAAEVRVLDPAFYRRLVLGDSIGAAEGYALGQWTADDLTAVIRVLSLNRDANEAFGRGIARLRVLAERLRHLLRRNSRQGSRSNIIAHYDLGNEFFSKFLDESMMYSCAIFPAADSTLAEASRHKNDLICRKLELKPGDDVVEIGTGWGGFALHAVQNYGCRVWTTTISPQQHRWAQEKVREAGLEDRITLLLEDYRDLPERLGRRFDKAVSIEMIEAVGEKFLGRYFSVASDLLKPDGMMLLQAIVIADQTYDLYRRSVDFIQRYIFPGSLLPSVSAMCERLAQVTDLRLFDLHDITPHYARTLQLWREQFTANLSEIREMGYDDDFLRLWEFYFCYCEGGFAERVIGDVQMLLTKPLNRRATLTVTP